MIRRLRNMIGKLTRDQRGVSAVEFAMLAPLMITMYFGSIEVSQGISIDRKLSLTARTLQISDLREFAAVVANKKRPDFSMEHDLAVQETLLRASGMLAAKR